MIKPAGVDGIWVPAAQVFWEISLDCAFDPGKDPFPSIAASSYAYSTGSFAPFNFPSWGAVQ